MMAFGSRPPLGRRLQAEAHFHIYVISDVTCRNDCNSQKVYQYMANISATTILVFYRSCAMYVFLLKTHKITRFMAQRSGEVHSKKHQLCPSFLPFLSGFLFGLQHSGKFCEHLRKILRGLRCRSSALRENKSFWFAKQSKGK